MLQNMFCISLGFKKVGTNGCIALPEAAVKEYLEYWHRMFTFGFLLLEILS